MRCKFQHRFRYLSVNFETCLHDLKTKYDKYYLPLWLSYLKIYMKVSVHLVVWYLFFYVSKHFHLVIWENRCTSSGDTHFCPKRHKIIAFHFPITSHLAFSTSSIKLTTCEGHFLLESYRYANWSVTNEFYNLKTC